MSASGQHNVDIDALLDLTEYDGLNNSSISPSPSSTSKVNFASPVSAALPTPNVAAATSQTLSGPSHNYDMYRQQTGFVPGALANTMAVNQTNNTGYQDFGSLDYLSNPENDIFDFNTTPSQGGMGASDLEMEFDSPADSQQFFSTINPSNIEQDTNMSPTQNGNVGRLWPGAHSQAALAKAQRQQQQHQQQHIMHQQVQRRGQLPQQQPQQQQPQQQMKSRGKGSQPTDPLVEQKITQLLNSMRAKPSSPDSETQFAMNNLPKTKKEEEEMDEDERLLASEEGKKLSSKERRQLRNKVSARAFRSRRKEYISQLEAEIAGKVNENGDLRAQNRALMDENKRLTDLTRMLLSSSSFSSFLDHLSANPTSVSGGSVKPEAQQPQQQQQQQDERQLPKDANPYGAQQSQQQIGMAMIPEQTMDFSMLSLDGSSYNFQPQVFVVDTPDMPAPIDTSVLSGKSSNFAEPLHISDDDKIEIPVIDRPAESTESKEHVQVAPGVEEFESDPDFALYHSEPESSADATKELDTEGFLHVDIFGGVEPEKVLARYELVDATEEEAAAAMSMARVLRISDHVESVVSRLELLTRDL